MKPKLDWKYEGPSWELQFGDFDAMVWPYAYVWKGAVHGASKFDRVVADTADEAMCKIEECIKNRLAPYADLFMDEENVRLRREIESLAMERLDYLILAEDVKEIADTMLENGTIGEDGWKEMTKMRLSPLKACLRSMFQNREYGRKDSLAGP